jgi:TP901 family phage tail tape measure protein
MGVHSNKGFLVPFTTVLERDAAGETLQEINRLVKEQVIRIRPELARREFQKELNDLIKDGMKTMSYYLNENNQISSFRTSVQVSPTEWASMAGSWKEAQEAQKETDAYGVERVVKPAQPAGWSLDSAGFGANAIAIAKLHEETIKEENKIRKLIADSSAVGNEKAVKQLNEDLDSTIARKERYEEALEKDQSNQAHQNTLARAEHKIQQATFANENKEIQRNSKLIQENVRDIEKLAKAKMNMVEGSEAWNRAEERQRNLMSETDILVGNNAYLKSIKEKGLTRAEDSLSGQAGKDDLSRYKEAMVARLNAEKELLTTQLKVKKNASENTKETQNYQETLENTIETNRKLMDDLLQRNQDDTKFQQAREKYEKSSIQNQEKILSTGSKQKSFFRDILTGWKQAAARVVDYTIAYRTLWYGVSLLKSSIQTIQELNKAFTDIQMVTGMTNTEVNILAGSYAKLAQEYGTTIQQVAQGATEWLRQGKGIEETSELLKQSMMMSKLGAIDAAKATEYLTSTLNGFGLESKDASMIVDTFSALDMAAATSTEELAIAFQRSANSAKDAGIDFNELAAYITVVSETTRKSASTIGESFKTLAARYMNVKVGVAVDPETGENINDVEKALSTVGIRIRTDENTWRDFGDVINEIGSNWGKYNEMQKNTIVTAMAGVRQAENFRALLNNFSKVGDYMGIATNSAGSAAEKYEVYLDSIDAKTNKLISTFQEIAYQPGWIFLYKSVLDVVTVFGKLVNVVFDNVGTMTALGVAVAIMTLNMKRFEKTAIVTTFSNLAMQGKKLATALELVAAKEGAMTVKAIAATAASKALMFAMTPWGLSAIAVGLGAIAYAFAQNTTSLKEATAYAQELGSKYDSTKDELQKLLDKQKEVGLTDAEYKRLEWLKEYAGVLAETLRLAKTEEYKRLFYGEGDYNPFTYGKLGGEEDPKKYLARKKVLNLSEDYFNFEDLTGEEKVSRTNQMQEWADELVSSRGELINQSEEIKKAMSEVGAGTLYDQLAEDLEKTKKELDKNQEAIDRLNGSGKIKIDVEYTEKPEEPTTKLQKAINDLRNSSSSYETQLKGLNDLQKKFANGQTLSRSEMEDAIELYPELEDKVIATGKGYTFQKGAIDELIKTEKESARVSIAENKKRLQDQIDTKKGIIEQISREIDAYIIINGIKSASYKQLYENAQNMSDADPNKNELVRWAGAQLNNAIGVKSQTEKIIADAEKELNSLLNDVDKIGIGDDKTSSGGADAHVEKFKIAYEKLQNLRDNSEISEKEYYDSLQALNNEYFANKTKYEKEYAQYDSEVAKGRQKLWKDEYDNRLNISKKYIDANKEDWEKVGNDASDSEIAALMRIKKYQEEYYADAKKNHKMYLDEIKQDIEETDLSIQKLIKSLVNDFKDNYAQSVFDEIQAKIDKLENQKLNDSAIERYKNQIESEKERLKLLEDQSDEEAKKTEEIKKQKQLIDSLKRQKDIRVYSAEKGWTWEQDRAKIVEEQTKLTEMEADLQKAQIQSIIDSLEEKLADAEKAYDKQIKALQKEKENLEYLSKIRENKEKPTIESVIEKLKTFGTAGEEAAAGLLAWVNDLRKSLGLAPLAIDLGGYKAPPLPAGTKGQTSYGGGGSGTGTAYDSEGKSQTVTIVNGKTQESLPVGTVVKTAGGNFQITGGTPGNYESIRVNDEGGLNTGKGMMLKNVIEPERVLSPQQTKSFESLVRFLPKLKPMMETFSLNPQRQQLAFNASDNSITIQNLNIQAPNGATLQSLLLEAKNIAKINKR